GNRMVYERFDRYWGQPARTKELVFQIIREPGTRVAALESGDVDVLLGVPAESRDFLRKKGFKIDVHQTVGIYALTVETTKPPFNDLIDHPIAGEVLDEPIGTGSDGGLRKVDSFWVGHFGARGHDLPIIGEEPDESARGSKRLDDNLIVVDDVYAFDVIEIGLLARPQIRIGHRLERVLHISRGHRLAVMKHHVSPQPDAQAARIIPVPALGEVPNH